MGVDWAADAVGAVPQWVGGGAGGAGLGYIIIVCIDRTRLTHILRGIPYHGRNTKHTFLHIGIQEAPCWTHTNIPFEIKCHSLSTTNTLTISIIPVVGWCAYDAGSVGQHKGCLEWADALVFG